MEAPKLARTQQAHEKKPQAQDCYLGRRAYAELSDTTDQDIRKREVEHTPQHVDGRRRESLT